MLYILGIGLFGLKFVRHKTDFFLHSGSNVAMTSCLVTEIKDHFKKVTNFQATSVIAIFGTILGSIYYTQGGQHILSIVDYYGATFIAFNLVVFELGTFCYIYGVDRICKDIQFMLGRKMGIYWRICWKFLTPGLCAFLVGYYYYDFEHQRNENLGSKPYPDWAYFVGWTLAACGLLQLPIIAIYKICTNEAPTIREKIIASFSPQQNWGPSDEKLHSEYTLFLQENK
jgi:solute carrier family 6 (neurotransmitter transporter, glycine) member 5/9